MASRANIHVALALRSIGRLAGCSAAAESELRQDLEHAQAAEAQTDLISCGEAVDRPRLLLAGWIARVRDLKDSRRQILSLYIPGDIFGFSPRPGAAAVDPYVAMTGVTTAHLRSFSSAWHAPAVENAALAAAVWAAAAAEEMHVVNQIIRIGRLSAYERLAHFLLEMDERLDAVGFVQNGIFLLPLTQEVLGDTLGLSVVHVNRTLQQLKRDKLVEVQGASVRLLDRGRLADLCDWRSAPLQKPRIV